MVLNIALIIFGLLCVIYDFLLIILNPGTFLDILTSFSHIWLVLGGYHIFLGIYRLKRGHSFWRVFNQKVKMFLISFIGLMITISIINLAFILTPAVCDYSEKADYVILLGGGIDKNGKLPKTVINRVEKTKEYLLLHPDCLCVVTGGTLKWLPYAEAPELKRQLVAGGISADKVLVEDQALDTIQNFQLSCKLIAEYENKSVEEILDSKIVVVTSRFHLRRAERLATRMGFTKVKGIPSKCALFYIPMNYVREICAYIKLNMRILFTGKPKHI